MLRQVKEQVYDLVSTSKSKGSLLVRDIAEDVDPSTIEIVIGVGIRQKLALNGLVGWSRMHLLNEVLNRDLLGNAEAMETVSTQVLQNHLMGGTNAPIYYYLENAGRLDAHGNLHNEDSLHERVKQRAKTSYEALTSVDLISKKNRLLAEGCDSFSVLALVEDPHLTLSILPAISPQKIDLEELRQFLLDHVETDAQGKPTTVWAKAVCLYDVLRHGPGRLDKA
ncbi:hypothetical protein ACRQ5B_07740 [Pseudarthrobacter sp. L19]|uniref:hypothetical protein n=1 Tax=Pseudarthrobacter sp. L19 TaxID=3423951 RepID=UPI003D79510E